MCFAHSWMNSDFPYLWRKFMFFAIKIPRGNYRLCTG